MELEVIKLIMAGLTAAVGVTGSAFAEGKIGSKAMEGIGRNPACSNDIFPRMIVAMALAETPAIFSFVVALIIVFL
ncbi:MAG: hypothetical protein A2233_00155 [Candidatus Kerfeldbacteria bacterium RIFOXYA2_FULL_38_24]|uniref:ATP synthase subunit c n=1 Tax=Candidatus Kerfeldbacteria bacterium RIFOXYB2_FULL_38_14 TaxID=1798547 RepID=A0A1G2BCS1_9BACT|nr:MAG: hypothetical protein A2233_00155 [Candidatus Kerfeldbacteria bacterium RIFOXYA2_FULL_38_24]OGY86007.1 MAG: hypothetical protein A2319_00360 [Candidatus Kerfeldbacteria bacterium RIFOXYB2_FULL_38_14]OGY90117.1 MAG: hypothetical protein A2458_03955 [Candidatus Kerfeldbacteria bacterium RIFOXYC2_FULL_38_9]